MKRWAFGRKLAVVLSGVVLLATLSVSVGAAEESLIRFQGRVEWISAQIMVIAPDGMVISPGGTGAINVDLSRVAQDEYQGLVTGDEVLVTGTVPTARNRVFATSIRRLAS